MTTPTNTRHATRSPGLETGSQVTTPGFRGSEQLVGNLQKVLVELIELHLQGKQAHWAVVGHNFRDIHLQLDEIIDAARDYGDDVAERIRGLHGMPDGRAETVISTTRQPAYPLGEVSVASTVDLVTGRLNVTTTVIRDVHDAVDAEDPTSADLLHSILDTLEKQAWMLRSENNTSGI